MLDGLAFGGVVGLTTIGRSADHAQRLHDTAVASIKGGAPVPAAPGAVPPGHRWHGVVDRSRTTGSG